MKLYVPFFALILTFFGFQNLWAKQRVCTVTINSSEERDSFKKHLNPKDFDFTELTDFADPEKDQTSSDWFNKACEAGVQCDVLVVSGHFGGDFFGELTNYTLQLDLMEKMSCSHSCSGILNRPQEVFLFGCNTLAEKDEKDPVTGRTPEAYQRDLIDHYGMSPETAQAVAQARHGILGSSFKARMQRVFSGVPHIYGFDAVGPSGKTVKPYLDKYFSRIKDYKQHLLQKQTERLNQQIDNINKATAGINNAVLADVLKNMAFTQCPGLDESDPQFAMKEKICELYDENRPLSQRLITAHEMLKSKDRLAYLPSVVQFMRDHGYKIQDDPEAEAAMKLITMDASTRNEMSKIYGQLTTYPALQVNLLNLQKQVGWVGDNEFRRQSTKIVTRLTGQLTREHVDVLCSLPAENLNVDLRLADFDKSKRQSSLFLKAADCLIPYDIEVGNELAKLLSNPQVKLTEAEVHQGLNLLATQVPGDSERLVATAKLYSSSSNVLIKSDALEIILNHAPEGEKRQALRQVASDPKMLERFVDKFSEIAIEDSEASRILVDRIVTQGPAKVAAAQLLVQTQPNESPAWDSTLKAISRSPEANYILGASLTHNYNENPAITRWAVNQSLNHKDFLPFMDVLSMSAMSQTDAKTVLNFIGQQPNNKRTPYLRDILNNQYGLEFTSAEQALLKGPTKSVDIFCYNSADEIKCE